ncbi:MAG: cation-translocating P-type ATPase [Acutalibacteraceae bacterium]|nr:cation-translocating P-type ATPase [Acutalibacteraceae bacterium]
MDQNNVEHTKPSSEQLDGLTDAEVRQRIEQGLVNHNSDIKSKSIKRIVLENLITPFNILNFILAILILIVGSYKNLLFMGVIICNIFIGTVQEIRAKKTIDKLSLIAEPKAHVIRNGIKQEIAIHDIVMDDITFLGAGNQVCSDAVVIEGECEVNESLLTGESEPVLKQPGDHLLSGSFIICGNCHARVEHVGKDNYATQITDNAKYVKKPNSEIMQWTNRIIKYIGFTLIPVGIALFCKQVFISHQGFNEAIVGVVAALIGMIPEGLILLTSVVFAVSVIRLSQHKTLVQELYCIETLARVDVLCLDKTGTITEGTMEVTDVLPLHNTTNEELKVALGSLIHALEDDNPTFNAVKSYCTQYDKLTCNHIVPFSSARKWSGASFDENGSYIFGATEFILTDTSPYQKIIEEHSEKGQRVLMLAHSPHQIQDKELPEELHPMAFLFISDKIRAEAPDTLAYFAEQGVDIKIISGDNAITVANIAKKSGLKTAEQYVDATTLQTPEDIKEAAQKYSVFGRVTPQQKLDLVKALKEQGHTVAMTGDGVNDVLALKESDCSIAMASGSDAARTVSQLVLLDSNFASMPRILKEGRRSINNLQRSSSLFLTKTIFSTINAILFIFLHFDYPFQPIHLTLISALTIGAPSFILALEPNKERVKGKYIVNVIRKSIPGAMTMVFNIIALAILCSFIQFNNTEISTLAVMITGFAGLLVLFKVSLPFNWIRCALFCTMLGAFVFAIFLLKDLFSLASITLPMLYCFLVLAGFAIIIFVLFSLLIDKLLSKQIDRLETKIK